jgi:hypothetical protein
METREKIRKSYIKPRLTRVKLEIQEAILAACKRTISDGSGKYGSGCNHIRCRKQQGS